MARREISFLLVGGAIAIGAALAGCNQSGPQAPGNGLASGLAKGGDVNAPAPSQASFVQPETGDANAGQPEPAPADPAASGLTYTSWTEPNQGAFTLQVPQGWKVEGGLTQVSMMEYRSEVTATSPDGLITAQAGNAKMLPFKQLTGTPFAIGGHFHQGSISEYHGWFMFLDYESGAQFSKGYFNLILSKNYQGLKLGQSKDCPELTQALEQAFAKSPVQAQISVGETDFAYTQNGQQMVGMCFATTVKPPGGGWTAYPGICTAPVSQIKEALEVLAHLSLPHYSQAWAQKVNLEAGVAIVNLQATAFNDRKTTDEIYAKYLKQLDSMGLPIQNILEGTTGH